MSLLRFQLVLDITATLRPDLPDFVARAGSVKISPILKKIYFMINAGV